MTKKITLTLMILGMLVYFVCTRPAVAGNAFGELVDTGITGVEKTAVFLEKIIDR